MLLVDLATNLRRFHFQHMQLTNICVELYNIPHHTFSKEFTNHLSDFMHLLALKIFTPFKSHETKDQPSDSPYKVKYVMCNM